MKTGGVAGWLAAINLGDLKPDNYPFLRVCSDHFIPAKFSQPGTISVRGTVLYRASSFIKGKPAALYEETNPDWVPSLKLGHGEKRSLPTSSRHDRAVEGSAKRKRNGKEQDKGEVEREIIEIDRDHEVNSEEAAESELEQVKDQLGAA